MSAKLTDLTHASPDAIMAAVDLGNLAFWEARREREWLEARAAHAAGAQAIPLAKAWWFCEGGDAVRRSARALQLTAWFNRADD